MQCVSVIAVLCLLAGVQALGDEKESAPLQTMAFPSVDRLGAPEWLQVVPEDSKAAKYRRRRFVNFPTGSTIKVRSKKAELETN